jgi:hypothetical protein
MFSELPQELHIFSTFTASYAFSRQFLQTFQNSSYKSVPKASEGHGQTKFHQGPYFLVPVFFISHLFITVAKYQEEAI